MVGGLERLYTIVFELSEAPPPELLNRQTKAKKKAAEKKAKKESRAKAKGFGRA